MLGIKRTYDAPERGDGRRILVERLWPRGMKKEAVAADAWMKEVAPSTQLRQWFYHRVERWEEFRRRYRKELAAHPDPLSVTTPIKISRGEVRTLLAQSSLAVWSNRALAAHAARLRARVAV